MVCIKRSDWDRVDSLPELASGGRKDAHGANEDDKNLNRVESAFLTWLSSLAMIHILLTSAASNVLLSAQYLQNQNQNKMTN